MRTEQLYYIYEIIASGSLRAAASHLHTTQQNLSVFVANLEKEIGTKIFERSPEGMHLTKEGENLLPLFNELSTTYEKILYIGKKETIISEEKGTLRFACDFTITRFITSDVIEKFNEMFPNINLTLIEIFNENVDSIFQTASNFDIILFPINKHQLTKISLSTDYAVRTVVKDSLVLICGKDTPLSTRKKVSISSLKNYSYVAFFTTQPESTWTYQKIFIENNIYPKHITQCNVEPLYLRLISNGAFSISTRLTARHTNLFSPYQIVAIPFKDDTSFYYAIATHKKNNIASQYFSDLIEKTLQRFLD